MAEYSNLGIFWLAFACFFGPIFLIALVCSIIKAVRTRKEIKRRIYGDQKCRGDSSSPIDAEIITEHRQRKKPNIKIIEDEARKKQFRSVTTGSLFNLATVAGSKKNKKMKDTDVDGPGSSKAVGRDKDIKNANNSYAIDDESIVSCNNGTSSKSTINSKKGDKRNNNHHHHLHNQHHNHHIYHNNTNGNVVGNTGKFHIHTNNGKKDKQRRSSLDNDSNIQSSTLSQYSNGHAVSSNYSTGSHLNLSNSHASRSRRSSSPILERIPEVKTFEMEMNTNRSRSEDNLIDHKYPSTTTSSSSAYPSSPYLTPGRNGSDNRGFARSTETTAM